MAGLVRTSLLRNLSAVRTFATSTTHRSLEQAPIKVFGVEGRFVVICYLLFLDGIRYKRGQIFAQTLYLREMFNFREI